MANAWQFYDDLVDALPAGVPVTQVALSRFAMVRTEIGGCGLALADRGGRREPRTSDVWQGRDLRSVAAHRHRDGEQDAAPVAGTLGRSTHRVGRPDNAVRT